MQLWNLKIRKIDILISLDTCDVINTSIQEGTLGMADIHYLHGEPQSIRQFIRIGHSGHRQLETLLASGRLEIDRAVFEAANIAYQSELLNMLRAAGVEIVLDTNMAETATPGRFETMAKRLGWANKDRPWLPSDFSRGANRDTTLLIADVAVTNKVNAVLAPTHLLGREGPLHPWFEIDRRLCVELRAALDSSGGRHIAIDYLLMLPYGCLMDAAQRRMFVARLAELPFDNLWVRAANFGRDATPMGFQRYTVGLLDFHDLGKPIVADSVGGLIGLGVAAFGSVSALSYGVAQNERFDPGPWKRPKNKQDGGGQTKWVYIPQIDLLLKASQAARLLNSSGARTFLACNDPMCCALGVDDTLRSHKAHFLTQRKFQLDNLSRVPETRRAGHFIDHHLREAERQAQRAAKLNVEDNVLINALSRNSERLHNLCRVAETLHETLPETTRCAPLAQRSERNFDPAQSRRQLHGKRDC